ncbi:hypothetical protein DL96DRAFT_1611802, partial [Flagelloscypha sp. PMI_526]
LHGINLPNTSLSASSSSMGRQFPVPGRRDPWHSSSSVLDGPYASNNMKNTLSTSKSTQRTRGRHRLLYPPPLTGRSAKRQKVDHPGSSSRGTRQSRRDRFQTVQTRRRSSLSCPDDDEEDTGNLVYPPARESSPDEIDSFLKASHTTSSKHFPVSTAGHPQAIPSTAKRRSAPEDGPQISLLHLGDPIEEIDSSSPKRPPDQPKKGHVRTAIHTFEASASIPDGQSRRKVQSAMQPRQRTVATGERSQQSQKQQALMNLRQSTTAKKFNATQAFASTIKSPAKPPIRPHPSTASTSRIVDLDDEEESPDPTKTLPGSFETAMKSSASVDRSGSSVGTSSVALDDPVMEPTTLRKGKGKATLPPDFDATKVEKGCVPVRRMYLGEQLYHLLDGSKIVVKNFQTGNSKAHFTLTFDLGFSEDIQLHTPDDACKSDAVYMLWTVKHKDGFEATPKNGRAMEIRQNFNANGCAPSSTVVLQFETDSLRWNHGALYKRFTDAVRKMGGRTQMGDRSLSFLKSSIVLWNLHCEKLASIVDFDSPDDMPLPSPPPERNSKHSQRPATANKTQAQEQRRQRQVGQPITAPTRHSEFPSRHLVSYITQDDEDESGDVEVQGFDSLSSESGRRRSTRTLRQLIPEEDLLVRRRILFNEMEDRDNVILSFPPGVQGAVNITNGDVDRLQDGEFLNDTLIEFSLKLWLKKLEESDPELAKQVHVFSSFFYKKLNHKQKWTNKFDLFEKKYIIVPINENLHWWLSIIYMPGRALNPEEPAAPTVRRRSARHSDEQDPILDDAHEHPNVLDEPPPSTLDGTPPLQASASQSSADALEVEEAMKMEGIMLETSSLSLSPDYPKKLSFGDDMDVDGIQHGGEPIAQGGDVGEDGDMYTDGEEPDHSSVSITATDNPLRSIEAEEYDKNDLASLFSDHEASQEQDQEVKGSLMAQKREIGAPPHRFYGRAGIKRKREEDQEEEDLAGTQESQVEIVAAKDDCTLSTREEIEICSRPWVLTLDSLGGRHPKAGKVLGQYLLAEAKDKKHFEGGTMACQVPTQPDYFNCGVYLIHFVEQFMLDPEGHFKRIIVRDSNRQKTWCTTRRSSGSLERPESSKSPRFPTRRYF